MEHIKACQYVNKKMFDELIEKLKTEKNNDVFQSYDNTDYNQQDVINLGLCIRSKGYNVKIKVSTLLWAGTAFI